MIKETIHKWIGENFGNHIYFADKHGGCWYYDRRDIKLERDCLYVWYYVPIKPIKILYSDPDLFVRLKELLNEELGEMLLCLGAHDGML